MLPPTTLDTKRLIPPRLFCKKAINAIFSFEMGIFDVLTAFIVRSGGVRVLSSVDIMSDTAQSGDVHVHANSSPSRRKSSSKRTSKRASKPRPGSTLHDDKHAHHIALHGRAPRSVKRSRSPKVREDPHQRRSATPPNKSVRPRKTPPSRQQQSSPFSVEGDGSAFESLWGDTAPFGVPAADSGHSPVLETFENPITLDPYSDLSGSGSSVETGSGNLGQDATLLSDSLMQQSGEPDSVTSSLSGSNSSMTYGDGLEEVNPEEFEI